MAGRDGRPESMADFSVICFAKRVRERGQNARQPQHCEREIRLFDKGLQKHIISSGRRKTACRILLTSAPYQSTQVPVASRCTSFGGIIPESISSMLPWSSEFRCSSLLVNRGTPGPGDRVVCQKVKKPHDAVLAAWSQATGILEGCHANVAR